MSQSQVVLFELHKYNVTGVLGLLQNNLKRAMILSAACTKHHSEPLGDAWKSISWPCCRFFYYCQQIVHIATSGIGMISGSFIIFPYLHLNVKSSMQHA